MNEKIIFWQSELGCSLAHGFKSSPTKSFSVSVNRESPKKGDNSVPNRTAFSRNHLDQNKEICTFCKKSDHDSLFECNEFKNSDMTMRCRFVREK